MAAAGFQQLQGKRILVVEDNIVTAERLSSALKGAGCTVVGPAPDLDQAMRLARWSALDGALLDLSLRGAHSIPVAALLKDRGVPFLFMVESESPLIIPAELRSAPQLSRPLDSELLAVAEREFGRGRAIF